MNPAAPSKRKETQKMTHRWIKEYQNIEKDFFELDEEGKIAFMRLEFARPSDIFDANSITKIPVLNDDFLEWIKAAFEYAPRGYRIDLSVCFEDLEGYAEDDLERIFTKNLVLEAKRTINQSRRKDIIAWNLVGLGFLLLGSMLLMTGLWKDGGVAKEIVSYVFDIATTVTFWEALTILIVENKERRDLNRNFIRKFARISFRKK